MPKFSRMTFFCLSTTFSMPKKLLETRASAASEVRWSTIAIGSKKKTKRRHFRVRNRTTELRPLNFIKIFLRRSQTPFVYGSKFLDN
jgi:hypothetical protein